MSLCTMPLFDVQLDCLDIYLIIWSSLIKMHIVYYISILTLIFYDSTQETVQVYTLTLFYDHDLTFWLGTIILKSLQFTQVSIINQLIASFPSTQSVETFVGFRGVLPFRGTFPIGNLILGFFEDTFFQKNYGVTSLGISFLFYFPF